jgi:hypothetical protein
VRRNPLPRREIVFQRSVACGKMLRFENEPKLQPSASVSSDRKSHRIVRPFPWQPRTPSSVAKIAMLAQFVSRRKRAFVAGRGALTNPSSAQWQPRRMKPAAIFQLAHRHKKWTSHLPKLLLRDEGIVLRERMDR